MALDRVCAYTRWPVGHAYLAAANGKLELHPSAIWHLDEPARFRNFQAETEQLHFSPGVGMPGRALASGKPAWFADITGKTDFPRAQVAEEVGLRGAFGFPIIVGGTVAAVLEFFSEAAEQADDALLELMEQIGVQLGIVIERKRAEEALRESEARYERVAANLPGVIYRRALHPDGSISYPYMSPVARDLLGIDPEAAMADASVALDNIHPDDMERFRESVQQSADKLDPWELEFRAKPGTGNAAWVRGSAQVERAENGDIIWHGFLIDVTARKQAEDKLRAVFETTEDAILLVDKVGIVDCNQAMLDSFGYTDKEALLGKPPYYFASDPQPDGCSARAWAAEMNAHVLEQGAYTDDWEARRRDGTTFTVQVTTTLFILGDEQVMLIVQHDLTERKRAEQDLQEKELQIRTMVENIPDGIIGIDQEGLVTSFNPAAEALFGYQPEAIIGQNVQVLMPETYRERHAASFARYLRTGEARVVGQGSVELEGLSKDGSTFPISLSIGAYQVAEKTYFIGNLRDITERRPAQAALRDSEQRAQSLAEVTSAANTAASLDEALQVALDKVCAYTGWPIGHAYLPAEDGADELVPSGIWHLERQEGFRPFVEITEQTTFAPGVGLPGRVFASKLPAWIEDVHKDPNYPRAQLAKNIGVSGAFAFPVLAGGAVAAVLEFYSETPESPDEALLGFMEQIGIKLGIVIERKLAEQTLRQARKDSEERAEQLAVLNEVGQDITATLELDIMLQRVAKHAVRLLRGEKSIILLVNSESEELVQAVGLGYSIEEINTFTFEEVREGISGWVLEQKTSTVSVNHQEDERNRGSARAAALRDEPATLAIAPLIIEDEVIGTLTCSRNLQERVFSSADLTLVSSLANQAAIAIQNARLYRAAQEAERLKSDFLANMSHEICTPMNAVLGMTHLAQQTELTSKQRGYLNRIQTSANNLLGIINDVLDFSKIEAGKLEMESVTFKLDQVLDNLGALINVTAGENELEVLFAIAPNVPTSLVGDPLRLGQVLTNLANNAVKFTESGEIVLTAKLVSTDADKVTLEFSVIDTGIGLSEVQIDGLFQAFRQADSSTTRKYGGTGLGLAISKQLVEMLGGEIWVESEPGQGSTFSFSAIFVRPVDTAQQRPQPTPDLRGMRVLVVDDNFAARVTLQSYLESFSFDIKLVSSGEACLTELLRTIPDQPYGLVLLDWKMAGIDGIETARRIKDNQTLAPTPTIIMVTAYGQAEVRRQAEAEGIEGFLLKPISQSTLFDTIMGVFGKELPSALPDGTQAMPENAQVATLRGAHVLLVEDNEINQEVAQGLLESAGLVVTLAANGAEAVQAVESEEFAAILMDIHMPKMDGYEATRTIRDDPRFARLPIIAMTAHAMAGDREKSLAAGMNEHITKPIDPQVLYATLSKWIEPVEKEIPVSEAPPKAKSEKVFPDLSGIDTQAGLQRMAGNHERYKKLLLRFLTDHGGIVDEIEGALEAKDEETAIRLAHTLKGVAGNIGAHLVQAATQDLEASLVLQL